MGNKRGRPIVPTSEIRVKRVKKLMEREKIKTGTELGRLIGKTQQTMSREFLSGKLSEDFIDCVLAAFPDYRKSWLLGLDDGPVTKTEELSAHSDEVRAFFQSMVDTKSAAFALISAILQGRDFSITRIPNDIGCDPDYCAYELVDQQTGNKITLRDDYLEKRIVELAKAELQIFLYDALKRSPSP